MNCVQIPTTNADSEMEEGEIVDDIDDNADISSEEEFLLRQRLQVLESYNNVLERKNAKRTSVGSGKVYHKNSALSDLSEISGTDVDDGFSRETYRLPKKQKQVHSHHKYTKLKQTERENTKMKEHKKKNHYKKRSEMKVVSETSESDDDYRNKRRKLASAVSLNNNKTDTSTLKDRLTKMLCGNKFNHFNTKVQSINQASSQTVKSTDCQNTNNKSEPNKSIEKITIKSSSSNELIGLCADEDTIVALPQESIDSGTVEEVKNIEMPENSDEDIEQLRQHALKTKSSKAEIPTNTHLLAENKRVESSEDEDSDTEDLRMICLRSALLKKAIEMKQKQKLQKRLSQSCILENSCDIESNKNSDNNENNTDIESVDMDIASDGAEKVKDFNFDSISNKRENNDVDRFFSEQKVHEAEEIEEDEDLLRAKLLTSLSKNLPNLVDFNLINNVFKESEKNGPKVDVLKQPSVQNEKKFIIQLGESDSEGDNEATKNLTKMHMKLSEQEDFQRKLDLFLKSSRMQVEQNILPDVIQPPLQKVSQKFIPKAMNHLPKSEQIEYKNLVQRMAELEKIKQARQHSLAFKHSVELEENVSLKETLKPHNVSLNTYKNNSLNKLDEKIAMSRKKIAEESAKMLKLREEAKKLSQRYKIAATELRNITTAITLNKKQQRTIQNGLFKVRLQHQMLLKSSTNIKHSRNISTVDQPVNKLLTNKSQKENDPSTQEQSEKKQKQQEYKDPTILKTVKVSVVNDFNKETITSHPRLSVQVDITNNKKTIKIPKSTTIRTVVKEDEDSNKNNPDNQLRNCSDSIENYSHSHITEAGGGNRHENIDPDLNDYKSPLEALNNKHWEGDPNAFLCPFEVGGSCRDTDCKYLHPKPPK